jgi:hypothetical protein
MKYLLPLFIVLATSTAHAEDRATAEKYFKAGAKAFAAQNFHAAASNFDEAFKALAMPEIAFSAAQAFRKLYQVEPKPEHVKRSIELYEFYLSKVKSGGRVSDAADNLTEMKRERDKLEAAGVRASSVVEKPQTSRIKRAPRTRARCARSATSVPTRRSKGSSSRSMARRSSRSRRCRSTRKNTSSLRARMAISLSTRRPWLSTANRRSSTSSSSQSPRRSR